MDNNRVIWQEGLFLRPQHFQQQERFLLNWVEDRCKAVRPYNWGFTELTIDTESLSLGKLIIQSCKGVFPDGTPFDVPGKTFAPEAFSAPDGMIDCRLYLGVPSYRPGDKDISFDPGANAFARYQVNDTSIRDVYTQGMDDPVELQTGGLQLSILSEHDNVQSYQTIPLAHIQDKGSNQRIRLVSSFIPTMMHSGSNKNLSGFIREVRGLLKSRGDQLASMMVAPGAGGVAEVANFLQLQLMNHHEPLFEHLDHVFELHPEDLYRLALVLVGEMSTFSKTERRPSEIAAYQHDDLEKSFTPLINEIRTLFEAPPLERAISLEINEFSNNYWAAVIPDRTLLDNARFVLAAKAELPLERLEQDFPRMATISTIDKVPSLVRAQSKGILIKPMRFNPQQIPIHAGFCYFEFDKTHAHWGQLAESAGLGFHFAGFPGLELELWAILS